MGRRPLSSVHNDKNRQYIDLRAVLGRENCKCKGPVVGMRYTDWNNGKKARVGHSVDNGRGGQKAGKLQSMEVLVRSLGPLNL